MRSRKLRKLVASIAMLAMVTVAIPGANVRAVDVPKYESGWEVNKRPTVGTISGTGTQLTSSATKSTSSTVSIENVKTEVLTQDVVAGGKSYSANSSEGGVVRLGLRVSGNLESYLRSYINDAVSEHRDNVNTVNSNRHNSGTTIKSDRQVELAKRVYDSLFGKDSSGVALNGNLRFNLTYELNGSTRTTSVGLSDITLDHPTTNSSAINSVDDLRSIVDENGLVYITLRGLPSNITITNVELDSRQSLSVVTNTAGTAYSTQSSIDYTAGRVAIPSSTWSLTGSLYPAVTVNGTSYKQFNDAGVSNVIEANEHVFVDISGSTVMLVDILKDPDKVVTGVTVHERRGNTYNAEVGDFVSGKYRYTENGQNKIATIDHGTRYRDIKILGLANRTTYEFDYMDITYKSGDVERTQRVSFSNSLATGGVTGSNYLVLTTSDYLSSQIHGYSSLGSTLYQVNVGRNSLEYIIKVDDVTNLSRIEVRGLRSGETYTVTDVKSQDGTKDKSNWFAVKIDGLEQNRTYDFLSIETVYNENGRERYGTAISLGRSSADLGAVLFPGNNIPTNGYNWFTTTNNNNVSEAWVDSTLKSEEVAGGVKFYGRIKDADDILDKVNVYVKNGSSYEKIDDSNVKLEKTFRVVKGLDINSDGTISGTQTIDYPFITSGTGSTISITESDVESASEMVEVTVSGLASNTSRDFRLEFVTTRNGNYVSSIVTGSIGAFGSIPTNNTKAQQTITRFVSGKAGATKVQVNSSNVTVSGITSSTASVNAGIQNTGKESIAVEVSGASGVTAKYDATTNLIELTGLTSGTEYKDLKLTLKYADKSTTVSVPTFKTITLSSNTGVQGGIVGYVTRVYTTFFDRTPDRGGLTYWTDRLTSKQETLKGFLGQLSFTPELLQKNLSNQKFVESMYAMVDRAGETDGVTFWVQEIEKSIGSGATQSEARASIVSRMLDTNEVKSMATRLGIKFE